MIDCPEPYLPDSYLPDSSLPDSSLPDSSLPDSSLADQYLLVCEARLGDSDQLGSWRFVLERLDGQPFLEATDCELGDANRLALLAVVRGLEALPGPAAVTMLSSSRYVIRSLSDSLPRWREAGFMWEHFGQRMEVTNADLWRRVDRALDIHAVSACCVAAAPVVGRRVPRLAAAAAAPLRPQGPVVAGGTRGADPRHERKGGVTDGLRRWLIGQCQSVAGGYPAEASRQLAVA
ncbi:RNase H family protein [Candidatus Laterigemmans baculatus]|uniref:RNase H family protein n=1 Tax=Candidatus Laterigemmans baculatus TaxID=2770505 RepID=UPI0013DA8AEB|nr:RNase H family protein [Candidatus Laterigemmans baculatus]